MLPPPPRPARFAERLRRHEPLLGALITADLACSDVLSGLDFAAVNGAVAYELVSPRAQLPVLVLVTAADQVAPARAAGADAVIAEAESALTPLDGVDAVLSDRGRARRVTSPEAARTAFASGADLVLYDLPAMFGRVLTSLGEGRPTHRPPTGREPLVLLSGMLGDASLWDGVAAQLGDLVLPCPARIDLDDSVIEMASSVLAEAPSRFALAGHSLGAIVALEIMRQAPERVSRLILVNASARAPVEAQRRAWARWRQRALDGEFEEVAAELALATLGPSGRARPAVVDANLRMAHTVGVDGFLRQLSAQSTRPDSRADLAAIRVPVLVVSGERDEICPPARQRELLEYCPGAELVSIEGGGHMLPLDSAHALAEHLRRWLGRR